MKTKKKIFLLLVSFYLLTFLLDAHINASMRPFSNSIPVKDDYTKTQETTKATSSGINRLDQTVARENSTETIQGGHQMLQSASVSDSASFTRHLMCKNHDIYYNPIDPTTIFKPGDGKAECLTTVSINDTIEFRWHYRSDSSKTWVSCFNWSTHTLFPGEYREYYYVGYLNIAGYWPGSHYPRAYRVDVYLDSSFSFSEFFEVTNGGLNSPRLCKGLNANGHPVNVKSRFTIGVDTEAHHYLGFDKIAYFNDELEFCHNFTTVWMQPDGSTYKTHSGNFADYKNTNVTWNYWKYGYDPNDYITINSSTLVGNWKVEVYLDSYYLNNTWTSYGPIATTPFVVGNESVADWTFMVYLDADNSLENASIEIFLKLASVNSSPQVNIIVQMDRTAGWWEDDEWKDDSSFGNWTDCKRFNITKGMTPTPENAFQDLGEANMGDPSTLKDFVNWTISNYPANYYFLVLWDHGTGCMGFCFDITNGTDALFLPELSQALSGLPAIMDVVLIDACSMGMVEVAYQIKDYANVLVGPEGLGYAPAPYDDYLTSLTSNPSMSPSEFAAKVVIDYMEWCLQIDNIKNATMSATNLNKIMVLNAAIDDFAIKLKEKETPYHEQLSLARNLTEGYQGPYASQFGYYIDLFHFAQLTYQQVLDEELRNAAYQVMTALSIGNAIIMEAHKAHPNSHGLSIFFPDRKEKYEDFESVYDKTAFAMDSPWAESVEYHLSGYLLTIQTPYPNIQIQVDEEWHTTDAYGKIKVFVLPDSYAINVTTPIPIGPGSREAFVRWNDSVTSNPRTIYVSKTLTLEAQYETQYRLIINTNFGTTNPSVGEHWYKAGLTVKINATAPSATFGERYLWLGWIGLGNSNHSSMNNPAFITIDEPINETAAWRHEYSLAVTSLYGSPMPTTQYFEDGISINASVTSPVSGPAGTQYVCTGWTGTGSVSSSGTTTFMTLVIDKPSSITWNWKTQYRLTVHTDPAGLNPEPNLSPSGPWYDDGTLVNCTAQKISEKVFDHWNVSGVNWSRGVNPINITMDGPYEAIAYYVNAPFWWETLFRPEMQVILGLVVAALGVALVIRRRGVIKARAEPASIEVSKVVLPGRITSGYADLDSLLLGGIPENYAVILISPSCDEKDMLIKRFLEAGPKNGEVTFYVTIDPSEVRLLADEFQSDFYVIVCNPRADAMMKTLPNVFKLKGVENLTEINIALTKAFRMLDESPSGPKRACVEIISDVLLQHHAVQTRRWLTDLITEMKSKGFTILAVINPQMHPSEEVHAILDLFEGEISIYEKETEKGSEKFLKIKKMTNQKYSRDELLLKKEKLET